MPDLIHDTYKTAAEALRRDAREAETLEEVRRVTELALGLVERLEVAYLAHLKRIEEALSRARGAFHGGESP
jgi:hypothetical protein